MNWHDFEVMARTVYGEARGEPEAGKRAVAHVILNRLAKAPRYGSTISDVCLKPLQFSAWNERDPNRKELEAATIKDLADCIVAILQALRESDITQGACHYFSTAITPPLWAQHGESTLQVGRHRFFRNID